MTSHPESTAGQAPAWLTENSTSRVMNASTETSSPSPVHAILRKRRRIGGQIRALVSAASCRPRSRTTISATGPTT